MSKVLGHILKLLPSTRLQPHDETVIMSIENIHRCRVILIFGAGLFVAAAVTLYQAIYLNQQSIPYQTIAAGIFACAGCLYGLWIGLWGDKPIHALRMLMVLLSAMVWLALLNGGGINGYNAAILPVLPVIAALVLTARDAVWFTVLHVLTLVTIATVWSGGQHPLVARSIADWHIPLWSSIPILAVFASAGGAVYMAFQNQKIEGQLRELLIHQAYLAVHDYLSGLGNRVQLQQRFNESPEGDEFDILLIDLDGFKAVNDTYGHDAGDYLIKSVSDRLREVSEDNDFVVRLGGDEFVILLENVQGDVAEVRAYGTQVIEILSRPYPWKGEILRISASIGHARYPLHAGTPSETLGLADKALYEAKLAGKGQCVTHGKRPVHKPLRQKRPFTLASPPHTRFV